MLPAFLQPLIAGGLSLLTNAAMSKGKDWIQEKTGVDIGKSMMSGEDLAKLRQYELDHEEELLRIKQEDNRLEKEVELAYLADVGDARDMQKEALKQDDVFAKRFVYYLTIAWSLMTMVYIGFITFADIPKDNIRFADTILGFLLGTILAQMMNFFFGSSRSSQQKDETMKNVIEGAKNAPR